MNLTEYITDVGKITNKVYRPTLKVTLPFESGTSIQGDLHTISCQGFVLKSAPE